MLSKILPNASSLSTLNIPQHFSRHCGGAGNIGKCVQMNLYWLENRSKLKKWDGQTLNGMNFIDIWSKHLFCPRLTVKTQLRKTNHFRETKSNLQQRYIKDIIFGFQPLIICT
jgi:hypothetical protein